MKEILSYITKAISGIFYGVSILVLAYVMLYVAGGEELFSSEILQITTFEIFIKQIILAGIFGYMESFAFAISKDVKDLDENSKQEKTNKMIWYPAIVGLIATAAIVIVFGIIYNTNVFTENIKQCLIMAYGIEILVVGVYCCIISTTHEARILNRKIKEKQRKLT